jgi:hypothetical protein
VLVIENNTVICHFAVFPPEMSANFRPPDISGLLEIVERREQQEDEILNNFEDWEEKENEEPIGRLYESMENANSQTWIKLIN